MTAAQYRAALGRLFLTQEQAAALLGVSLKQSQRWANGHARVHPCAALILRLLAKSKITIEDLR